MDAFAVIPARSGSKGVKDKNIYLINGKPLLCYAIETAKNCPDISETYISTDSETYQETAINCGAKSLGLRNPDLASDSAKTIDTLIDIVKQLKKINKEFDYLVLLQPTSPVRKPEDISNMLQILNKNPQASSIVSVSKLIEPHPYKLKKISKKGYLTSFIKGTSSEIPRQAMSSAYKLNGAIYIIRIKNMLESGKIIDNQSLPYIMEEGVNIDTSADLEYLNFLISTGRLSL
ncbi:hypothetical protein GU926_17070 [Nibribacter ruber]|uniref:Acylneuraminate cytidylyltransferase family protein n=1 Tax=Nibribacter ruber TaxID=2698458 RepID=A0A6P1P3V0_9BACT|nr:acylneuraminate cytidylyltransferase family protein [Nibribacter ruber]QHL89045.1 hypothetical protein GU926_17070 [Nibribacter ruber]